MILNILELNLTFYIIYKINITKFLNILFFLIKIAINLYFWTIIYLLFFTLNSINLKSLAIYNTQLLLFFFALSAIFYIYLVYFNYFSLAYYRNFFKNLILFFYLICLCNFLYYIFIYLSVVSIDDSASLETLKNCGPLDNFSFVNIIGLVVIYLCYFVGLISLTVLGDRFWSNTKGLPLAFLYFPLVVTLLCSVRSLFALFLCYELLLLPSLYVVYKSCYTRRAQQANIYFFVWTQLGSILVLCPILYLLLVYRSTDFIFILNTQFTKNEIWLMYLFFFFGFGVKVPVWPLQYWLVKIHVEAPSGFSIFLSGFLVKSGIYCFFLSVSLLNVKAPYIFPLLFCTLGILDSSLKFWGQEDIKKLIAYATVQEMNIIYLLFNLGSSEAFGIGCIFLLAHGVLSSLLFFIVECVYRRTKTRSISKMSGLSVLFPNLSAAIWAMLILFLGFPGTLKFYVELKFILLTVQFDILFSFIVIFVLVFVGSVGFAKCWFSIIYGMPRRDYTQINGGGESELNKPCLVDLTRTESVVIGTLVFLSIVFCFFVYMFL